LVGTSSRNLGSNGIPFWESTDGGATFTNPVVIGGDILQSDKPWLAVDNAPGTGQHDVYVTFTGKTNTSGSKALWMVVSTNGSGGGWTNPAVNIREPVGFALANSPILQVGSDHIAYAFWLERTGNGTNWTNSIM